MELDLGDRLKFIGCEVIYREACRLAAESPYRVDVEFLRKGLHDLQRQDMLARIQQAVDSADAEGTYKAILLGYARCNDGVAGLQARSIPLIIPRAHDCISFFFGSATAYQKYFDEFPGTYFRTTGWTERDNPEVPGQQGVMARLGLDQNYDELVAKYGAENADYIWQTIGGGARKYSQLCYLEMSVCDERPFIEAARAEAARNGWHFDHRKGDWSLLRRLFAGPWKEDDFVIINPGKMLEADNSGVILRSS